MKTTHYKFLTDDGRTLYVLSESKARDSAARCNGTYCGPADPAEVRAIVESALRPDLRHTFTERNLRPV